MTKWTVRVFELRLSTLEIETIIELLELEEMRPRKNRNPKHRLLRAKLEDVLLSPQSVTHHLQPCER